MKKKKIAGWTIKSECGLANIINKENDITVYSLGDIFMFENREEAQKIAKGLKRKHELDWTKTVPVYLIEK